MNMSKIKKQKTNSKQTTQKGGQSFYVIALLCVDTTDIAE